ncbi:MAG TPA: tRNA uridine-5-carboxymethylaminomethyl(34) synthesis GTPase MnmE [Puia sp.]|jgi:tRNA modification GTPase|nr:tRNA uridine-5-carboxymethylaminomethyl(34) synthesis GTPase MnmE [Puia sp.]
MLGKFVGWDDTIVALATPPGVGAIGVIRISGNKSFDIADQLFPSKKISKQLSHTLHVGHLREDVKVLDEVVVALYKGPKSYTGEDVIEISSHGSPFIHEKILQAILNKGARLAKPGEFTQRAFLNGKLDLTQAEAVADLISSNSNASLSTALHNMRGGFSKMLKELRDRLLSFSALIELELDFSQEDVEFADRKKFYELIELATVSTNQLIDSFRLGNVIKNGVQVAIVGKPNSGKSTLLNALLNDERAIVSEIAGTTRDTIEETINIDGILFRLIDTAGIRQHSSDVIENIGMERSLLKMQQADIVIYLFDAAENRGDILEKKIELENDGKAFLQVANKTDLLSQEELTEKFAGIERIVFISARKPANIEILKKNLVDQVLQDKIQVGDTVITNERHLYALQKVSQALRDIQNGLDEKLSGDLIAPDIRQCLHYLGEITGEITSEDQLNYIFSKFCIGK